MDEAELSRHEQTYHRFMLGVKWFVICFASGALFLGIWFATGAGFLWGLVVGVTVLAAAIFAMTHGLAHSTEGHHVEGLRPPPAHG